MIYLIKVFHKTTAWDIHNFILLGQTLREHMESTICKLICVNYLIVSVTAWTYSSYNEEVIATWNINKCAANHCCVMMRPYDHTADSNITVKYQGADSNMIVQYNGADSNIIVEIMGLIQT